MPFPRILFAAPLVLAGILTPAAGALAPAPVDTVGMVHEDFNKDEVHIHRGEYLTFVNDSHFIHILGVGRDGHLVPSGDTPVEEFKLMQQNDTYTTGPWNSPGTYYVTCSVHPEMTAKVVVDP